jgi:type II secretory pathway pseudopilin PulG
MPSSRRRAGLTLIEVVIAVLIVLVLTAALAPSLIGVLDRQRVADARETLDALVSGMSDMRKDNQDWPSALSQLTVPITTGDKNLCGNNYTATRVSNWSGPYLSRVMPATGLPIGIGTVRDTLVREVINGNDAYAKIQVDSVKTEDAIELDKLYDNDGSAAGTVRWGAASAAGQVTLFVLRPVRGC